MDVIGRFLEDRVKKVVDQLTPEDVTEGLKDYTPEDGYVPEIPTAQEKFQPQPMHPTARLPQGKKQESGISDNELDKFLRFDLPRIDNKDYFRAVFD